MLTTQCPHCKTSYRVPETQAGKTVRCKKCGGTFTLPMNLSLDDVEEVPVLEEAPASAAIPLPPPLPAKQKPDPDPEREPLPLPTRETLRRSAKPADAHDDDDIEREYDTDRPRRQRSRSRTQGQPAPNTPSLNVVLLGFGGLAVLGLVGGVLGLLLTSAAAKNTQQQAIFNPPGGLPPGGLPPGLNPGPQPNPKLPIGPQPDPKLPIGPQPDPKPPAGSKDLLRNVPEAIEQLRLRNRSVMENAFFVLRNAEPDPKHFQAINEAVAPLLDDFYWASKAVETLTRWANPQLVPHLAKLVDRPNNTNLVSQIKPILEKLLAHDECIPLLGKLVQDRNAAFQVLPLVRKVGKKMEPYVVQAMNKIDSTINKELDSLLVEWKTDEKLLRDQTVKDLRADSMDIRRNAVRRLTKLKPDPTQSEQISTAGEALLKLSSDFSMQTHAFDAMKNGWISQNQVPALINGLKDGNTTALRYIEILGLLKAPESLEPMALFLDKNPFAERQVREAFVAFGPGAEETAMKLVGHRNLGVHRTGLQILGEIGTSKSLNALTKAAPVLVKLHPSSQQQLLNTVAQIRARQNQKK
jgi:predicted Zn finger-like uncharacterized protein